MATESFQDLPKGIQDRIIRLHSENAERWACQKIPALGNRSILEVMDEDDGYRNVCELLGKLEGHWL